MTDDNVRHDMHVRGFDTIACVRVCMMDPRVSKGLSRIFVLLFCPVSIVSTPATSASVRANSLLLSAGACFLVFL